MVAPLQASLDDEFRAIDLVDFSGGLNSEKDLQDLALNETPDCLNVYTQPGRLLGRKGYTVLLETLPAKNDGTAFLYDVDSNRRMVVWSNGNLYQVTFGIASLIATGVYTAGQRICKCVFYGVLYYSDGITPLRQWDAHTGVEQAVPASGLPLTIPPPACRTLIVYEGSIVAGATTVAGTFEPDLFRWCHVNDPTSWDGTAVQAVGRGYGGTINCMSNLGVSDQGVSPFKALFVGKDQEGVFGYSGPLGQQAEFLIPAAIGVLDGETLQYIPGPDGSGVVAFLATDRQVWYSNGIKADVMSKPIRTALQTVVLSQVQAGQDLFSSVVNYENYQYILDCGTGIQFCYDWQTQTWTKYTGWQSGFWARGADVSGFPAVYNASSTQGRFSQCNNGDTDNGVAIQYYWKTGLLNGGNSYRLKLFQKFYITFATLGGQLNITIQEGPTADGSQLTSTFTIVAPASGGAPFILDSSLLDGSDVLAGDDLTQGFNIYRVVGDIMCPVTDANYAEMCPYEMLSGGDVQLTIAQTVNAHFEILGARLHYINRGYVPIGMNAAVGNNPGGTQ